MLSKKFALIIIFLFAFARFLTIADMRSYVWTYEYLLIDPGKAEIEHYMTISTPKINHISGNATVEHKVELEVGMNKFFDFSIYQNFVQTPGKSIVYTGFDLRARFKIGEKNMYPLDPLIYVEYGSNATLSEHKFETKFILAKDIGAVNISLNPIGEFEKESSEWHFLLKYAVGIRYQFSNLFRFGTEFKGGRDAHYFGLTFSHGKEKLWIAVSPTFRFSATDKSKNEFQLRTIIGLGI